jgi:hypothetical protein
MATLSQADVEAIVDALVDAILKRGPLHPHTPAQTVFESCLIVDDCLPADKPGPSVEIDNYHPAGDVFTPVDAFCQHADARSDSRVVLPPQTNTAILILLATSLHSSTHLVNTLRTFTPLTTLDQVLKLMVMPRQ